MVDAPSALPASRRPLTPTEKRLIRGKMRQFAVRGQRASTAFLPVAGGVVLLLWLWTLLASDAPILVITAFWLTVGAALTLWVRRGMRGHAEQLDVMRRQLESALTRDAADVYDIRAHSFAELEEVEDEGACYAFQIDGDRIVFVSGQEFYEAARFPSIDFSLVYVLDERNQPVDMFIDKRGAKASPARTIPAPTKNALEVPDHLEVRLGRIDDLERILRRRAAPR